MNEDPDQIELRIRQDAAHLAATLREDAEHKEEQLRRDPRMVREWLRQNNLIYGGLIGIGVVIIQPFLAAGALDLPATICVVAFSLAIPLLAALVLLNEEEAFRRRASTSLPVDVTKALAQFAAFVGVVAAFWHIIWIAGVGILVAAIVGLTVHSVGYSSLERDTA